MESRCDLDTKCMFNHEKLKPGDEICYKCGKVFMSKRELGNHIIDEHGQTMCHQFLKNECTRRRCYYSHRTLQNVVEPSKQASALTSQDFPNLPTTRPVVGSQETAQTPQDQSPALHSLSPQVQNQIRDLTSQVIETHMKAILPQLLVAVSAAMTEKKTQPQ